MMRNLKSDHLDQQNQDAYDDLIVSIEAGIGRLNLLIAVCDYQDFRQQIISRYQAELQPDPSFRTEKTPTGRQSSLCRYQSQQSSRSLQIPRTVRPSGTPFTPSFRDLSASFRG